MDIKEYSLLLSHYNHITEIDKLRYGAYIRWINKNDDEFKLKKGMIICDISINEGIIIKGKTFPNKFINIKMDECHIFQKLTNEELIIREALKFNI